MADTSAAITKYCADMEKLPLPAKGKAMFAKVKGFTGKYQTVVAMQTITKIANPVFVAGFFSDMIRVDDFTARPGIAPSWRWGL